jgi:hypothetical protein
MATRIDAVTEPSEVREKTGQCLSCPHAVVRVGSEREGLSIRCRMGHSSAIACPDYRDDGRKNLLLAIVDHIRRTQRGYRSVFNVMQPDCPNCTSNCCTRPNLKKTPFFGEDAIYYLLIGQPLPKIPKHANHCIFFDRGCTLSADLRPHACIEYKCPFVENPPRIDVLGERLHTDVVYLLAVATRDFVRWRGLYPVHDVRGGASGVVADRFENLWDPANPTADLEARYRVRR